MTLEPLKLGRGRGRGGLNLEDNASSSDKRPDLEDSPTNGQKRGRPTYNEHLLTTKPQSAEGTKQGTFGNTVQLSANYFRLNRKPNFRFTLYRVDIVPDIDDVMFRKAMVRSQSELFKGYLFDGRNMIYLTHKLSEDEFQFKIQSREGLDYVMTVKDTGMHIDMKNAMALQILNLILRQTMGGLKMQQVGRNLYDPENKKQLKEFRIELWPGYITSIRQHEQDILVCAEISHKVMRLETVYDILRACEKNDRHSYQENFRKEIIGAIVLTDYNNKTYRVNDVNFSASPKDTFMMKEKETSFAEYYEQRYKLKINDLDQPMLISNPKAKDVRGGRDESVFLVPELCRATGLTDKMRTNFTMMRKMAEDTQMDPEKRKDRLLDLNRRIYKSEVCRQKLESFNTVIDKELVSFEGRALPQEMIIFGGDKTAQNDDRVDWTNPMKSNSMYASIPLKRWVFIYPRRNSKESQDFLVQLRKVATGMRYDMSDPKEIEIVDDRTQTYVKAMEDILKKDPAMIMIVVPTIDASRYSAIKRLTCIDRAVPTQVIVAKTMMPKKGNIAGVLSIATKVMIQINCKLGGAPWMIKFPLKGVMTIGFDVTHDTSNRSKSYGAFIATMDLKSKVGFFSAASAHTNGEEISGNISQHIVQAMKQYKNQHGALPDHIFFYRDGVGDGQIEYVFKMELLHIRDKLDQIYARFGEGKAHKLTFFIVNKKINTRIFLKQGARFANPVSGTIVDNTITLPERYDFYLVSQSVRQGTVAPTSYNVISDDSGLRPDQLQILTYKHTHLYYNWSGCTRVPAVVQYAHKLAMLVGQHLHQAPSLDFGDKLFFL